MAGLRVLDTDTLSLYKRGHEQILARLNATPLVLRAITLATNGTLITANTHHFKQNPGLAMEDWTTIPPQP